MKTSKALFLVLNVAILAPALLIGQTRTTAGSGNGTASGGTSAQGSGAIRSSTATGSTLAPGTVTSSAVGGNVTGTTTDTGTATDASGNVSIPVQQRNVFGQTIGPVGSTNVSANGASSATSLGLTNTTLTVPFNQTNVFGQTVGIGFTNISTNIPVPPSDLTTGGAVTRAGGGGAFVQSAQAASLPGPGFTEVTITLNGVVRSDVDRQSILQRFQNIPGFVVNDQIQVVGQDINEAAGAATPAPTRAP